ncbi:subtilisin-like protease SBT1.2 [Humulus lupulus]|uniref:subtilisin-like protease SBT1.2 n=1 Tax=Humulus lupulus TaxID=3486 RepID=UPI002B407207|nr:subtilisin-like protease SBT1.2 [Humulus lupulus]
MGARPHFLLSIIFLCLVSLQANTLQTYIVQLHSHGMASSLFTSKLNWHISFLEQSISSDEDPSSRLLYSYSSALEGFAAQLTESELESMQKLPSVVAIRPDERLQLQTTYSYKFLGLSPARENAWYKAGFGRGTIIGVLDTGVWPESPSFNDHLMPPVPKKWKGICQPGQDFNSSSCNRKLIGARFFIRGHRVASTSVSPDSVMEYVSPRDSHGHGSHTTSTAGGASVTMANVLGNGMGVARGIAPFSHVAAYKVCWYNGCYSSDILAAMDAAILDGVDILSLSLGGFPIPLFADSIAIGSFRAMEHGVTVICAAGNNGPIESSVANEAPWVATIGASTMDRKFPAAVQMGNGRTLYGESLYPGNRILGSQKELEIVYVTSEEQGGRFCLSGSLPKDQVRGKMVVCDRGVNGRSEKGQAVLEAGGLAMILTNTELNLEEDSVDVHVLPATAVGFDESIILKTYINSTRRPMGRIKFGGTIIGKSAAPGVAQFSGRGPSFSNPSILKPDVIAPGVNIIAAWPQNLGPSGLPEDSRKVNFTVMSGTSMACPHVSGIAALIHSAHPRWSPAAVKSAIMTTADVTDHSGKPIMDWNKPAGVFAVGAGHVNPVRALDPGLVYDTKPDEYVTHLCTLGYTASEVFSVTHKNVSCHQILMMNRGFSLNYPSISVIFKSGMRSKMISRRVTNVGSPNSIYSLEIGAPQGVKVIVKPKRLIFTRKNQVLNYKVWFISRKRAGKDSDASYAQGHLTWVNAYKGLYRVRSPISVTWKNK